MNFDQAEAKFKELQARVQRGESITRAEYEEQVSALAVQDDHGGLWEINPRNGKWMRFDGASWTPDTPPGRGGATPPASPESVPESTPKPQSATPLGTPPVAGRPSASAPQARAPLTGAPLASDTVAPWKNVGQTQRTITGKPASQAKPTSKESGNRREWIPLAIGAVVLFACGLAVLLGYTFLAPILSPKATATPTRSTAIQPTVVPTIVRLPSPTPLPPTPLPVTATSTEASANVRSSPSTAASKVATVKKDQALTLVARTAPLKASDGKSYTWYQINVVGATAPGWIREDVIKITGGDPNTLPLAGPVPTPTATPKVQASPAVPGATATLTPIGVIPTAKP